mgnify:CR=1 FL=1|jgi:hypothetical protein
MGPPHLFSVGSPHRGMLAVSLGVEPRLYGLTVRCTAIMLGDTDCFSSPTFVKLVLCVWVGLWNLS